MVTRSAAERRAAIVNSIQPETGIDEAMIGNLVDRFYDRVRRDKLIAVNSVANAHNIISQQ
jgi:truncated hemoglobin YjbI